MATINGTNLIDYLIGTEDADVINGFADHDTLIGNGGDDTLQGGGGNDSLEGGAGADTLFGGAGNDTLLSYNEDTRLDGGDGVDLAVIARQGTTAGLMFDLSDPTLPQAVGATALENVEMLRFFGGSGNDIVTGGDFTDYLSGSGGVDTLAGGGGNDELIGGAGDDILLGGDGDDDLIGTEGADTLLGGAGNDILRSEGGSAALRDKIIDGGDGVDTAFLSYDGAGFAVNFSIADPTAAQSVLGTTLVNVERIGFSGGLRNDIVTGGDLDDSLSGGTGDDVLDGGAGKDSVRGGAGADTLRGGAGDDFLYADSLDTRIDGGEGSDYLSMDLSALASGYSLSIATPETPFVAGPTTVLGIDQLYFLGGAGTNDITGGAQDDRITGGAGGDVLKGGGGADYLDGGAGDDVLNGGQGHDFLLGGSGNDLIYSDGSDVLVNGGDGVDFALIDRSAGKTGVNFTLADPLEASQVDNTVVYLVEQIEFRGGSGADQVTGGQFGDRLLGGKGDDVLNGAGGDDVISGGIGKDLLTGGDGADIFRFATLESRPGGGARDIITDFQRGSDKIDIAALGVTDFADLTFLKVGAGLIVYADIDGGGMGSNDFGLQVNGASTLSADDFIFA